MLGILAFLWIIQVINNADHYRLSYDYGIEPRRAADLSHILTAPFLHWSWAHIEGNSLPLLVLGFLVAYRSIPKFIGVTAIVLLTSGVAVWLTSPSDIDTVGASGVIFGWFGYVIVRGFFSRSKVDIVVGVLVMLYYLPIFTDLLPAPHLSYQGHIGGFIGGILCGWLFRTQRDADRTKADAGRPGMPAQT
jgi:membrane associated rhomboid family serine protease